MLRLDVQPLPGAPFTFVPEGDRVVLGRSSGCDLRLPSRYVSRQHARLFERDGQWFVEDLGSHNGTRVNDETVREPTPIGPGDVVAITGFRIFVREAVPAELMTSWSGTSSSVGSWAG